MSSQVHGLTNDEVSHELKKMTAFIEQEAREKAREIQIKADEEFSIEKSKLVRAETDAIDATFAKRFKQAAMSQQIARSTVANRTRLRVLAERQRLLDDLFEVARQRLADATKADKSRYADAVGGLLLEGFLAMAEPQPAVRARAQDYDLVEKAIADAAEEYKKRTGAEITATIDKEHELPADSIGGIIVVGGNGKIEINNTLEARLDILKENALPAMRETLFGKNPNRKFYD